MVEQVDSDSGKALGNETFIGGARVSSKPQNSGREKAYVPKRGDIVVIRNGEYNNLVEVVELDGQLFTSRSYHNIDESISAPRNVFWVEKTLGLSLDRIQAEYISRSRIQKRIDELKEQKNSYSVEMKCLASTTEQYKNLLTNFWILTGEIKELESLLSEKKEGGV